MKAIVMAAVLVAGVGVAGVASAQEDAAKAAGCMKCHALDQKKKGPSYQSIAEKYKGKADGQDKIMAFLKAAKDHPVPKISEAEQASIVKWILSL